MKERFWENRQWLLTFMQKRSIYLTAFCIRPYNTLSYSRNRFAFYALREKRPYSEFFWFVFSLIWTEYGQTLRFSPYSFQMWENTDKNNSEYGHFSRSDSEHVFQI